MKKTCLNGHIFFKTSDCPACPVCEKGAKPKDGFLSLISAPARRAMQNSGITTLEQLALHTEKDLLQMHGFGPGSIPRLKAALEEKGLKFRK